MLPRITPNKWWTTLPKIARTVHFHLAQLEGRGGARRGSVRLRDHAISRSSPPRWEERIVRWRRALTREFTRALTSELTRDTSTSRPHSRIHFFRVPQGYAKLFLVRRTMKHDVVTSECFSLWIHFPTKITDWKKFIECPYTSTSHSSRGAEESDSAPLGARRGSIPTPAPFECILKIGLV